MSSYDVFVSCKMLMEREPDNEQAKQDYLWMCDALEWFENYFFESGFWHCTYDYMAVARKSVEKRNRPALHKPLTKQLICAIIVISARRAVKS